MRKRLAKKVFLNMFDLHRKCKKGINSLLVDKAISKVYNTPRLMKEVFTKNWGYDKDEVL